jgi:hypothetical protein
MKTSVEKNQKRKNEQKKSNLQNHYKYMYLSLFFLMIISIFFSLVCLFIGTFGIRGIRERIGIFIIIIII